MKFSDFYRLNKETHWIYQYAHYWWIFFALTFSLIASLILPFLYFKKFGFKILWLLLSITPIIIFIITPHYIIEVNSMLEYIWTFIN